MKCNVIYLLFFSVLPFVRSDECIVYDFENDFDTLFSKNRLCNSMAGAPGWSWSNYSMLGIDPPHSQSSLYISAGPEVACIESFIFKMSSNGVLEFNVFIKDTDIFNSIVILVMKVEKDGHDSVVGNYMHNSNSSQFIPGWQNIKLSTLYWNTGFEAYFVLMGRASKESAVLVDSFRYIPYDVEVCDIYPEITTEAPVATSTELPDYNEDVGCITYSFEYNFDNLFYSGDGICSGMTSWSLGNYSSLDIEKPYEGSSLFIYPKSQLSCARSFTFPMSLHGTFEINVFMDHVVATDMLSLIVLKVSNDGSVDRAVATSSYAPMKDDFIPGWKTLRVTITSAEDFEGYVIFIGQASSDAVVLVDSFRYIPPTVDEDVCEIYP